MHGHAIDSEPFRRVERPPIWTCHLQRNVIRLQKAVKTLLCLLRRVTLQGVGVEDLDGREQESALRFGARHAVLHRAGRRPDLQQALRLRARRARAQDVDEAGVRALKERTRRALLSS